MIKYANSKRFDSGEALKVEESNGKIYDLENRTLAFAKRIRLFIKSLERTLANLEDAKQLIRSSGSVGANYIEANESLSKKDLLRIKICRKEAKESGYWLQLLEVSSVSENEKELLLKARELVNIFGAILRNCGG